MQRKALVLEEGIVQAMRFATWAWEKGTQSKEHFLQTNQKREEKKFLWNQLEGKLGELGFAQFAKQFGITVNVNWQHYDSPLEADNHNDLDDIWVHGQHAKTCFDVDIKGTKSSSYWLLVEDKKYFATTHHSSDSDRRYVSVKVLLDSDVYKDPHAWFEKIQQNSVMTIETEIMGYARGSELLISIDQGERIWRSKEIASARGDVALLKQRRPMGIVLDTSNHCLPMAWLHNTDEAWQEFFLQLIAC